MKVTGCHNCPFKYSDYNPDSIGCDTVDICVLAEFLDFDEVFIAAYNITEGSSSDEEPPIWCPLRLQPIKIFYE